MTLHSINLSCHLFIFLSLFNFSFTLYHLTLVFQIIPQLCKNCWVLNFIVFYWPFILGYESYINKLFVFSYSSWHWLYAKESLYWILLLPSRSKTKLQLPMHYKIKYFQDKLNVFFFLYSMTKERSIIECNSFVPLTYA